MLGTVRFAARWEKLFPLYDVIQSLYQTKVAIGELPCKQQLAVAEFIPDVHRVLIFETIDVPTANYGGVCGVCGPIFVMQISSDVTFECRIGQNCVEERLISSKHISKIVGDVLIAFCKLQYV